MLLTADHAGNIRITEGDESKSAGLFGHCVPHHDLHYSSIKYL